MLLDFFLSIKNRVITKPDDQWHGTLQEKHMIYTQNIDKSICIPRALKLTLQDPWNMIGPFATLEFFSQTCFTDLK